MPDAFDQRGVDQTGGPPGNPPKTTPVSGMQPAEQEISRGTFRSVFQCRGGRHVEIPSVSPRHYRSEGPRCKSRNDVPIRQAENLKIPLSLALPGLARDAQRSVPRGTALRGSRFQFMSLEQAFSFEESPPRCGGSPRRRRWAFELPQSHKQK